MEGFHLTKGFINPMHWRTDRVLAELHTDATQIRSVTELRQLSTTTTVTPVFAAKNPVHTYAVVLKKEFGRKIE